MSETSPMNCFEWQSRASDYLDGTLVEGAKRDADEHLDQCKDCNEKYQHYRLIITSIASQPRSSLPVPIRRSPFTALIPKVEAGRLGRSRWERIPWFIRTSIEGAGIVLLILIGISAGPKIRKAYEQRVENSLSDFTDAPGDPANATDLASAQTAQGPGAAASAPGTNDEFTGGENGDEASDEEEASGGTSTEGGSIHVGSSEIWRFNLKTDSPEEIRAKVVQILADLKLPASVGTLNGIRAPGGIQFDLLVPQSVVPGLKTSLEKIAPDLPKQTQTDSPLNDSFTWYKNRSKTKIPAGQTRVVIWLSQL